MEKIKLSCAVCRVTFLKPKFRHEYNLKMGRLRQVCSKECRGKLSLWNQHTKGMKHSKRLALECFHGGKRGQNLFKLQMVG